MPPVELLINDLEHDAAAVASSCGADDLAQRPRDPALTSDHLADVVLCDEQAQDDEVIAFLLLDAHRVRLVHEASSKLRQQLSQCSSP